MKRISLILIMVIFSLTLLIETALGVELFIQTAGGGQVDRAYDIQQTSDDGFIIVGYTNSFGAGDYDVLLLKYDKEGNLQWSKTAGGSASDKAHWSVQQTVDGGYILAGGTNSYGVAGDVLLLKFNQSGGLDWTKVVGGEEEDYADSVQQTSDGGYIVTGGTKSYGAGNTDVFFLKFNQSGGLEWAKTIGGENQDFARSVGITSEGGYILTGTTQSYGSGSRDAIVIKCNSSGGVEWAKTFGESDEERGFSTLQTTYGGFVSIGVTGSYSELGDQYNILILKLNNTGNLSWAKLIDGRGTPYYLHKSELTSDGGFVVACDASEFLNYQKEDVYLLKYDSSANIEFAKRIGGSLMDDAQAVRQTTDGGYVIAGFTMSFGAGEQDALFIKTDKSGNIGSCDYSTAVSPNTYFITPSVGSPNLSVSSVTPIVSSPSITVSPVSPEVSIICNYSPGDIDGDGNIDLNDTILALQIFTGKAVSLNNLEENDVTADGKIGIEEVVYILQHVAELR